MANAMELDKNKLNQEPIESSRFAKATQDKAQDKQDKKELGLQLIEAAKSGNLDEVQRLVEKGAEINAQNKCGWTALICAAQNNHTKAIQLLIALGADIEIKDVFGSTALMRAAIDGAAEATKLLIKLGADIHTKDNNGNASLMWTAYWEKQPCCELLVEAMIAQEKATLCFLLCNKKAKENKSILQYLSKDIVQLIAKKYCWHSTREEINKINNTEMKQILLDKYFPKKKN